MTGGWVVTGASRGIGRAIAARAAADGSDVVILARGDAAETARAIADETGSAVHAIAADVTDPTDLDRAMAGAGELLGGIGVLVCNAAVHRGGRVGRQERSDWDDVIATGLTGVRDSVRSALPHMAEGSCVVSIGAVVGLRGFPGDTAYAAAKAGLVGLTLSLAVELAPKGVRANVVVPGFTETEMTSALSQKARESILARIPLGRAAQASEIADVVAAVAGATYMTGSVVAVDGGLLAALGSAGG